MLSNVMELIIILFHETKTSIVDNDKSTFCKTLNCDDSVNDKICGMRPENEGYRLRIFKNECQLLKYGCEAEHNSEYGIINIEYCEKGFTLNNHEDVKEVNGVVNKTNNCFDYECLEADIENNVCGMENNGSGFRIRLFRNSCELNQYNCVNDVKFIVTDFFICHDLVIDDKHSSSNISNSVMPKYNIESYDKDKNKTMPTNNNKTTIKTQDTEINRKNGESIDHLMKTKNLIIVDAPLLNTEGDINDTIDKFFEATHVFDLPLKEVGNDVKETRRMHIKVAGPVKVFKPWVTIPENISEDYYHEPTLSTCFHRCPKRCPDTYEPVCGRPGVMAREPSLVFKNHCYLDYAQCKMRWEDKSPTAISSGYTESSFIFCLGVELNAAFRFLPLIRTLQHMGRLKKKGRFHYKMRNMRFFNNLLRGDPKLMG